MEAIVNSRFCANHGPTTSVTVSQSALSSPSIKLCEYKDATGKQCQISIPRNANSRFCPAHKQWYPDQGSYGPPAAVLQRIQPHMVNPPGYVFNRNIPPTSTQPPATTTLPPPPVATSVPTAAATQTTSTPTPPATTTSVPPMGQTPLSPYNPIYQQQIQQQIHQQQMLYQKQLYMKSQGVSYPPMYSQYTQPGTNKPPYSQPHMSHPAYSNMAKPPTHQSYPYGQSPYSYSHQSVPPVQPKAAGQTQQILPTGQGQQQ